MIALGFFLLCVRRRAIFAAVLAGFSFGIVCPEFAGAQETTAALLNPATAEFISTPAAIRPKGNKYPASLTAFLWSKACLADKTRSFANDSSFTVTPSGAGVRVSGSIIPAGCKLIVSLSIDSDAAVDGYQLLSMSETKAGGTATDLGRAIIQMVDTAAGATPSTPEVDVMWGVLSKKMCGNNFGKHVQDNVLCVEVKIGNNSGHQLQLAGVGFRPKAGHLLSTKTTCTTPSPVTKQKGAGIGTDESPKVRTETTCLADVSTTTILNLPDEVTPNVAYQTVRGSAQALDFASFRNLLVNGTSSLGILMGAFNPFFHSTFNNLRWTAGTTVVGTSLPTAIGKLAPDLTIQQLNNLDDQSLRDGKLIPNNTQIRTMVFVERKLFEGFGGQAYKTICAQLYAETKPQQKCIKTRDDPFAIKLALGKMVIVGDYIDYIQRVVVDSGVNSQEANPAGTIVAASLTLADHKLRIITTTSEKGSAVVKLLGSDGKDITTETVSGQPLTDFSVDVPANSADVKTVIVILPSSKALTDTVKTIAVPAPGPK